MCSTVKPRADSVDNWRVKVLSCAGRRPPHLGVLAALATLIIASACGQAASGGSTDAPGAPGHPKQTALCVRIWNTSILMPLHRSDNLVPHKVLRAASGGSVYFNRPTNACVATLFYDEEPEAFLQLIYFSADPDGGPIRLTYSGQDKNGATTGPTQRPRARRRLACPGVAAWDLPLTNASFDQLPCARNHRSFGGVGTAPEPDRGRETITTIQLACSRRTTGQGGSRCHAIRRRRRQGSAPGTQLHTVPAGRISW